MSVGVDEIDFEREVEDALASLPRDLQDVISNVAIAVEGEPPAGQPLLGLYQGIPLTRRGSGYTGVLPDKITIYRGPLERLYGADRESLRRQIPACGAPRSCSPFRDQRRASRGAWPLLAARGCVLTGAGVEGA